MQKVCQGSRLCAGVRVRVRACVRKEARVSGAASRGEEQERASQRGDGRASSGRGFYSSEAEATRRSEQSWDMIRLTH